MSPVLVTSNAIRDGPDTGTTSVVGVRQCMANTPTYKRILYSRKLYGTAAATANNVANIIVPTAGRLSAIQWAVRYNSITDGGQCDLEISLASAKEIAVNAAQQCLSAIAFESNFVTSGLSQNAVNAFFPVHAKLSQGQSIYLHCLVAGTIVFDCTAILWFY